MFLPFYYSDFISLAVLTKLQMFKAMNFNLNASLTYGGNPYNLTHKPTFQGGKVVHSTPKFLCMRWACILAHLLINILAFEFGIICSEEGGRSD